MVTGRPIRIMVRVPARDGVSVMVARNYGGSYGYSYGYVTGRGMNRVRRRRGLRIRFG